MGIAITLKEYLKDCHIVYEEIEHPYHPTSIGTANSAHIPGDSMAKGVLLRDDFGYMVAVLPSSHMIDLKALRKKFGDDLNLATEEESLALFDDCDVGAVPPIGAAYGMRVVWDDRLASQSEIYFEGGDHKTLVHVSGGDFNRLMSESGHDRFSSHV